MATNLDEVITSKEPYLGSVRFFKHLFISIFVLLITVPTIVSIILAIRISGLKKSEKQLRQKLETDHQIVQAEDSLFAVPADATERPDIELPSYTELYPDFYAPEIAYSSVNINKSCYLTFDDGPSERTKEILVVLDEKAAPATFFVTKQDTDLGRTILKEISAAGHTIGMHSASHKYEQLYASVEDFLTDYYELYTWIKDTTGNAPAVYRFPGGSVNSYNRTIYQEIIAEMSRRGFVFFDWNVSAGDAYSKAASVTQITQNCLKSTKGLQRVFILMHDSYEKETTVAALPLIIDGYLKDGFTIEKITPEVTPVAFSYPD